MRIGVIVDSACDLPHDFIKQHGIHILPVSFSIDGQTVIDDHSPEKTRAFHASGMAARGHSADTQAFSSEQIRELFLKEIVTQYDFALVQTITRARSQIYANAEQAMSRILTEYRPLRAAAGREGPFSMRVIDSGTFFAGQGLLAAHTQHLIEKGVGKADLRNQLSDFTNHIHGCLVPRDLGYVRERGRQRGDKSVPALAAFLSKALKITPLVWGNRHEGKPVAKARSFEDATRLMFDYAVRRVLAGLLSPYVCISYGMSDAEFEQLPGLADLRRACDQRRVTLLATRAGITSTIHIGPGCIGLALAAPPHTFN